MQLPAIFQQSWTWIVQNKEWVLSGIGTAIVMAVAGYFWSQIGASERVNRLEEKAKEPTVTRTDTRNKTVSTTKQSTSGDQSPAINNVKGDIMMRFDAPEKKP